MVSCDFDADCSYAARVVGVVDHWSFLDCRGFMLAWLPWRKRYEEVVAYSSVAHMGFVTLDFLSSTIWCFRGLVQMIAHGFVSGAMFLCIGVLVRSCCIRVK